MKPEGGEGPTGMSTHPVVIHMQDPRAAPPPAAHLRRTLCGRPQSAPSSHFTRREARVTCWPCVRILRRAQGIGDTLRRMADRIEHEGDGHPEALAVAILTGGGSAQDRILNAIGAAACVAAKARPSARTLRALAANTGIAVAADRERQDGRAKAERDFADACWGNPAALVRAALEDLRKCSAEGGWTFAPRAWGETRGGRRRIGLGGAVAAQRLALGEPRSRSPLAVFGQRAQRLLQALEMAAEGWYGASLLNCGVVPGPGRRCLKALLAADADLEHVRKEAAKAQAFGPPVAYLAALLERLEGQAREERG